MKLPFSLLLFIFASSLYASEEPYTLPITRDGVTHTMVAYNFWSGEYPSPVIYVQPTAENWSKVMGYSSLRNPSKKKACTIKTGIYHPWTKDEISLKSYYSIAERIDYLAQSDTVFDGETIKKGDKLENEVYLSEGFCSYLVNKKTKLEINCIGDAKPFKRITYPTHPAEQWLYLSCKENYKVFIQDDDLLSYPYVTKGQISGYGEVTTE